MRFYSSMNEGGFIIIWSTGVRCNACLCDFIPGQMIINALTYGVVQESLGDVDYLRDEKGLFVGVSLFVSGRNEELIAKKIESQYPFVEYKDGLITIKTVDRPARIECVQAVGSILYLNSFGDIAILVPNWGVEKLGKEMLECDPPLFL